MKRIFVVLAVAVISLAAVDWEYEVVDDPSGLPAGYSILTLDRVGTPHILFIANDAAEEVNILKFARHVGENWQIRDVDSIPQYKNMTFSFDFNPANEVVIAYNDSVPAGEMDIFLAIEGELAFDYVNLTDDVFLQIDPVVHVGSDGVVRLIYREQNDDGFNIRYGWYDGEDFFSESIRDSMGYHLWDYDFCLDADNEPHVFYSGDDGDLWYAIRAGANDWTNTSLEISGKQPSVMMDPEGNFHIGYENSSSIYYLGNASGSWVEEIAQEGSGDPAWIRPSLALDPLGIPHMTWYTWFAPYSLAAALEVWYSTRNVSSWSEGAPLPPEMDKLLGYVNPFHICSDGYGHVCYTISGELYYVKTTEPLSPGVTENPVSNTAIELTVSGSAVMFSVPRSGLVHLELFDASGRKVNDLVSASYPAGEYRLELDRGNLPPGTYFVNGVIVGQRARAGFVSIK